MIIKKKTDLELIELIKNGDQNSFEELISRYSSKAFSLASRLTQSAEDAEEVLQDAFLTVYRKIDGFEGKSQFSSWFYRVTVNSALMKLRKKRQTPAVSLDEMISQSQVVPSAGQSAHRDGDLATIRSEVCTVLEGAIADLPEDYRPVFVLRDVDGLTNKEVAKILSISIPAVKSRLHRSRLILRKSLTPFYRELNGNIPNEPMVSNG